MDGTKVNALILNSHDNVAVLLTSALEGEEIHYMLNGEEQAVKLKEGVPIYHKVSIKDIKAGEAVVKYGHIIGEAEFNILKGTHVHCHNLRSAVRKKGKNESVLGL